MRMLFVHQNFPAQYNHLVKHCASLPGCEAACIGESANLMRWPGIKGVRIHGYSLPQEKKSDLHPYLVTPEKAFNSMKYIENVQKILYRFQQGMH